MEEKRVLSQVTKSLEVEIQCFCWNSIFLKLTFFWFHEYNTSHSDLRSSTLRSTPRRHIMSWPIQQRGHTSRSHLNLMKAKMPPTIPRLWKLAQHAPTSALNTAKQFPHCANCSHCTKYTFCTLHINHLTIYIAFWPPCKFHTADTAAEQLRV